MAKDEQNILEVTKAEQYKTIDELFKRSEPNSVYYALLFLSALIIASGLLLNNSAIVIGGMLVTPVLTPMLVLALAMTVGELRVLKNESYLLLKSFAIIVAASIVLAALFGMAGGEQIIENTVRAAALYFLVALSAGIAATFAWVRRDIFDILPGVAIAVSIVPPLSFVGIQLSVLNVELSRFYFAVFLFNAVGILLGSFVVFTILKFTRAEKKIEKKGKELEETIKEKSEKTVTGFYGPKGKN